MTYQKTKIEGFVKDSETGAILNTQVSQLDVIRAQRRAKAEQDQLKAQVQELQSSMSEIKDTMAKILEALNK
jgi:hypothetical protein